ncbi:MAG: DUF4421 domain-containing protein [Flavobacteriales bacterium]|nr:DUF4421 domain-containing protein [Flavobacteriales bacterium]
MELPKLSSLALVPALLLCLVASAQGRRVPTAYDTSYVHDYTHRLTTRFYLSTKYNAVTIASASSTDLVYRPNNKINMGLGASYRALTLNIGFGIPFVNNDDAVRGRTRYFDAQANIHTQRWATNLFLQVFGGYYIPSHSLLETGWQQETERPYRADLVEFNLGGSSMRILNHRRFSYRATFSKDAWQHRSQGTFLFGGYLTYYELRADSSLVPSRLSAQFDPALLMHKARFMDLGPMGGYAHTFVYKDHWFATVSVAVGAGASLQRIFSNTDSGEQRFTATGPGWHGQYRAGAGYNSRRTQVVLSINQENIGYLQASQNNVRWAVGNIRLNLVRRFDQRLPAADRRIGWFRKKLAPPAGPPP